MPVHQCQSTIAALLHRQQAEKGRKDRVSQKGEGRTSEAGVTWARENERKDERKKEGEEAQEACSCVSILNNQVCVRASAHHRRTASTVQVLSQCKKNHPSCPILGPIRLLCSQSRQTERPGAQRAEIRIRRAFQQTPDRWSTCGLK